ncbi:MAG: RNA-binding S4 domain-containing protein [Thermoanaerobaculia bacterium]
MTVRLDKWLQVARVFKTRSQATRACGAGRVRVNDTVAKAHRSLALGDRVEVTLRGYGRVLEVRELRDRPLPRAEAPRVFEDLTPPEIALPARRARGPARSEGLPEREPGQGRPTKRDRRRLDRLRREE